MMKCVFENQKLERVISGKCKKIIAYNKQGSYCGLLLINHPGWIIFFLKEENTKLKLRTNEQFYDEISDIILISFFSRQFLITSNKIGQIFLCQKFESENNLKLQLIYQGDKSMAIQSLAFFQSDSEYILFILDKNAQIQQIEFIQNDKKLTLQSKSKVLTNIKFLLPSKDQKSILIMTKEGKFIIFSQKVCNQDEGNNNNNNNTRSEVLEIDPAQLILLGNNQLSKVKFVDFSESENELNIFLADETYLYKLSYIFGKRYISIICIICIDQDKGEVKNIFSYPSSLKYPYEVTLVQTFSVNAFQLTQDFTNKNLWENPSKAGQKAYLYTYQKFGTRYTHLIHHISNANDPNAQFQYDSSKGYIYAFAD